MCALWTARRLRKRSGGSARSATKNVARRIAAVASSKKKSADGVEKIEKRKNFEEMRRVGEMGADAAAKGTAKGGGSFLHLV